MKLAIVGSRTFNDYPLLCSVLSEEPNIEMIISGGARGADSLAKKYAQEHHIPLKEFIPDWDKFGKSAGYRRNVNIVTEADKVIAFWDGKSHGTKHSIDITVNQGKPIITVLYEEKGK